MADSFLGAWLVTEYVYDPDGSFAGFVHQRRSLDRLDTGRLRVTQICEPSSELATHPMAAFAGEWVFELEADGPARRYLGPDVVGHATEWAPGAMTGRGLWPRFGHTFESYSVMTRPDRQLTGGFFASAGRSVADVVGVAGPDGGGWPELDLDIAPPPVDLPEPHCVRRVGPLLVAECWPDPELRVRVWAMRDQTGVAVEVTERWPAGRVPAAEITVTDPESS